MFGLKKNKKKSPVLEPETKIGGLKQVHVMPERFYVSGKKKKSGVVLVIILGLIVVVLLIITAFYLNQILNNNNQPSPTNLNTNVTVQSTPEPEPIPEPEPEPTPEPIPEPEPEPTTEPEPEPQETFPLSSDIDQDDLTLAEETLYGTNPNATDTDQDTFADGQELINGYDPKVPGGTRANSGLFASYASPSYTMIYPTTWTVKDQDQSGTDVLFVSNQGDFVQMLVIDNISGLSLEDWYQQNVPSIDAGSAVALSFNNLSGFRHPNELSYYLTATADSSKIYIITYNPSNREAYYYFTTFHIMANSLLLF